MSLVSNNSSWATLDTTILSRISAFAGVPTAKALPSVCKTWKAALPASQPVAPDLRVGRITIFSSRKHDKDDALIANIKNLALKEKSSIIFLESEKFEVPGQLFFSLEELPADRSSSLNSVIQLTDRLFAAKVFFYTFPWEAGALRPSTFDLEMKFLHLFAELYCDPYFKKIILEESFRNYDPHKHGLNPSIAWKGEHASLTAEQESILKKFKEVIQKIDKEIPKTIDPSAKERILSRTLGVFMGIEARVHDLHQFKFFFTIAEFCSIAKTKQIGKKLQGKAPFDQHVIFDIIYLEKIGDKVLDLFKPVNNLNIVHRSDCMVSKVKATLKKLASKKGMNLKEHSVIIYTGSAHLEIVKAGLSSLSMTPIVVEIADKAVYPKKSCE